MRLLKFYGRTIEGTLDQVRRRIGADALIVETREIRSGSAVERMRPGARFEVTAAVDDAAPARRMKFGDYIKQRSEKLGGAELVEMPGLVPGGESVSEPETGTNAQPRAAVPHRGGADSSVIGADSAGGEKAEPSIVKAAPRANTSTSAPAQCGTAAVGCASDGNSDSAAIGSIGSHAGSSVLSELAELKAQLRELLDQASGIEADIRDHRDLVDYRHLVKQGVDLSILAPSFRRWLAWKTSPRSIAASAPGSFEAAFAMTGGGFREWLWAEWTTRLAGFGLAAASMDAPAHASTGQPGRVPEVVGVLGRHGVGKSTTLAKMASKIRLEGQKKVAVISLDSSRPGASEQWRRVAPIMDIAFFERSSLVNSDSYTSILENFDWVGIDTPGGLMPGSPAMADYGALLARSPLAKSFVVLDTLARDPMNRAEISRMRTPGADQLVFTKLDLAAEPGALLNLTFEGPLGIAAAGVGTRAPEDLEAASPEALWRWVFASPDRTEIGAAPRP